MVNKHIRRGRYFCFDFGKISQAKCKQRKTFRLGFNRLELSRRFACFLHTWSTEMSKLTNNMQNKLFSNANDITKFSSSNLTPFAFTTIFGRFRAAQDNKCFQSLRNGAEWSWFGKARQTWQPRGILPNRANPDDFATGDNSWERLGKMLFTVKICSLFIACLTIEQLSQKEEETNQTTEWFIFLHMIRNINTRQNRQGSKHPSSTF